MAEHAANIGQEKNSCRCLKGNPETTKLLGRQWCKCEWNIKTDRKHDGKVLNGFTWLRSEISARIL